MDLKKSISPCFDRILFLLFPKTFLCTENISETEDAGIDKNLRKNFFDRWKGFFIIPKFLV